MHKSYRALADAIVQQACEDFVGCHLKLLGIKRVKEIVNDKEVWVYKECHIKSEEKKVTLKRMIIDCVSFFKSDWFEYLKPDMDGEKLMTTLTRHVHNTVKEFEKQQEAKRQERVTKTSLLWDGNTSGIGANY